MPDILRIPANTKAFLKAAYDEVEGVFDVTEFAYDFRRTGGLWGYWKLDETSGNRLPAFGGCDLIPYAAPDSPELPGYTTGKFGNAVTLPLSTHSPGTMVYAPGGSPSFLDDYELYTGDWEPPWSVAFWWYFPSYGADRWGFDFWLPGDFCIYFLADPTNHVQAWGYGLGSGETAYLWDCDAWHLCVFTLGEGVATLYMDNAVIETESGMYYDAQSDADFGIENSWDLSECAVDELSIWNDCLTPSQVAALWNGGAGLQLA